MKAYNPETEQYEEEDEYPEDYLTSQHDESLGQTPAEEQKEMLKKAKIPLWLVLGGLAVVLLPQLKQSFKRITR